MSVRKRHGPKLKAPARFSAGVMLISASMLLLCHTHYNTRQISAVKLNPHQELHEESSYDAHRIRSEDDELIRKELNPTVVANRTHKGPVYARSIAIELMKPLFAAPRLESSEILVPEEKSVPNVKQKSADRETSSSLTEAISSNRRSDVPEITPEDQEEPKVSETNEEDEEHVIPDAPVAADLTPASSKFENSNQSELEDRTLSRSNATKKHSRALPVEDLVTTSESKQIERNSDCALILKRTYILANPQTDEWGEKFVFNDADDAKK